MANKEDSPLRLSGIRKLAQSVQNNIDALYQRTHFSSPMNYRNLADIRNNMDKTIDDVINNNINNVGSPSISRLYSRLNDSQKDKSVINDLTDMFSDKNLTDSIMNTYMQNTYLRDQDHEIDVVCKYMPKLLEALEVRKDNVLASDHFSKDFVNIVSSSSISREGDFNKRIKFLKETYNLQELIETCYDRASKYGEQFVYIVSYKKAFKRLLDNRNKTGLGVPSFSKITMESKKIIFESGIDKKDNREIELSKDYNLDSNFNIEIELSNSYVIESVVSNLISANSKLSSIMESVNAIDEAAEPNFEIGKGSLLDKLDYGDFEKLDKTKDGLIDLNKEEKRNEIKTPGCVIKLIDRSNIVPIYIEDSCLGYYYLEFKENDDFTNMVSLNDPMMGIKGNNSTAKMFNQPDEVKKDQMLRYMSNKLSSYIDSKFINANQDLRKEIYMILKHNDVFNMNSTEKIKVTFLPPDDVHHIYFKKDPKTHRGISDLSKALFPAKLYSSLYITNSIGVMTRGQDKRVYYVKQSVDTNIAKNLLNTINQIKKGNFGIRQIENMNYILNITGRYNDYVIPRGPNGDAPVDFEILQGQNIEIKTELMNALEEMAINSTDVPIEVINTRQSIDYAIQLTMTNSKFLRKIYNRQSMYQKDCSEMLTTIYNAEYETNEVIEMMLPPPMFLNITNTNQIMDNAASMVNNIVETEMSDEQDPSVKAIFTRELRRHYLGSYIDYNKIDEIKNRAEQLSKIEAKNQSEE